jgi:iron(III) transport system substrate-binding protein
MRARIGIEHRAAQRTWDLAATNALEGLGAEILAQFDPPQAKELIPQARDPDRRWYGVYANYNAPAYNTNFVKPAELPKSYEEFVDRKQWAGKVAIDATDSEWLTAMFAHYGEQRGSQLARDIVAALKPAVIDGRLNLARQVGAGEYWIALNNLVPLTINVKLAGGPSDFWALDPVALAFGSVGINTQAPHPKTALLAANFMLSHEGQTFLTKKGRLPSRPDVETNPPGVTDLLRRKTIIATVSSPAEQRKMQQAFNEIFRPR